MKKNRTMRAAALLLALTLMTSCFVGGTFAKYVSTASGTDSARVAKWSFKVGSGENEKEIAVDPEIENLYINLFDTVVDDEAVTGTDDDANVKNGTGEVIIAPGTGGKFDIVLTNASEVTAKYAIAFTETENENNIPIQYSLNGTTWSDSAEGINITASEEPSTSTVIPYASNNTKTVTVYWRWAFEGTTQGAHEDQTDETDTALGIAAQGTAPSVTVKATITATQVD